jgi:D-alanyl-D-alanine carboxypeptidase
MDFRRLLTILVLVCVAFAKPADVQAAKRGNSRFSAITVDARTGGILFADNADSIRYPASLTKMMTLYILFGELKAGHLNLSSNLKVSVRASRMAPSKLGLKAGSTITVEQAIKGLIIKSANDVAAVVGENLGVSESVFAERMTKTARDIGMSKTTYRNASGLPNPGQTTTARDQATLSLRLMRDFPQYYPYFRLQGFNFKGRTIRSHNRLVGHFPGADGLKTGYIGASGYNLATSARRGDKRLVGIVLGGNTASRRNSYMMTMLNQYFGKAKDGRLIAALAGSQKGAIDPIAMASATTLAAEIETPPVASSNEVARMADAASQESTEEPDDVMDAAELAEIAKAGNGSPIVVEAQISNGQETPEKLPFALKEEVGSNNEGDWNIQVGIFKTERAARRELAFLRGKLTILNGKESAVLPVVAKRKQFYRARFAGFDKSEAQATCVSIKKLGAACMPLSPAS